MANKGSILKNGDYLHQDDYLLSANGFFCAYLHDDGNLCIYTSGSPDVKTHIWSSGPTKSKGPKCVYLHDDGNLCIYNSEWPDTKTHIWSSGPTKSKGPKCACLHDDGNLCIYNSEWSDAKTNMWCSGSVDPVQNFEISGIEYDIINGTTVSSGNAELYRQTLKNETSQQQTNSISGKESISETYGWSDSLAIKVGAKTTFKCGIPVIANGKIEISAEISNTFTFNGSATKCKEWTFNSPVIIPPYKTIVSLVSVKVSTIAVPYIITGTVILESGKKIPNQKTKGVYTGSNSHDLNVVFIERSLQDDKILVMSKTL